MHGKVSANQIDTTNQAQTDAQTTATVNNTSANGTSNDNDNNTAALTNSDASATTSAADSQNNAATAITDNVASATTTTATAAATATTSDSSQQTSYNQNDNGNYASLDSVKLSDNGQLQVSGWNATNSSEGKPYHYIIAYDNTTKSEIARTQVTNPVNRPDVQKAHNVYGAAQSGFNVNLKLSADALADADSISFISRYSASASGNSNYTDFWFAPITFDKENHAYLDSVTVNNNQLQVSGWNATNLAANKPYHTISVYDRTTKQVVASQTVKAVSRPDVAKAYPDVDNADQSGFNVSFDLSKLNLNHQLQIISSYSADANAQLADAVNYYFTPITNGNYTNQGNLDGVDISNGQQLIVAGWHADDISKLESNHYLILFDNTANKQVTAVKSAITSRSDVAKAYPSINTAANSGFRTSFNLNELNLTPGHSYSLVSRYSTSANGNGGDGQYTDKWFSLPAFNKHENSLDSVEMTSEGLHVTGWMASDFSLNRNNAYIIVLSNGKEIGRQKVELYNRTDVAKAKASIYNSLKSGFNTTVKFDPAQATGNLQILMRFSGSEDGNSNYDDQYSSTTYATNAGSFDQINVSDNGIYVSGWHASDQSANKPYQYLIFVDAESGKELYRQRVLDINRNRPDVASAEPAIINSGKSGYQLAFTIPTSLDHHTVRIIHRITNDVNGNGDGIDVESQPVSIHADKWAWPFPAVGEGHFSGAQLFGVNPGGEFRQNGFHDGLDFGSYDHPGAHVQAIHSGKIVSVGYTAGLDWYVLEDTGDYLIVYQEAFASRGDINVTPGQQINVGDVIGTRDTSHVHIGITKNHNFNYDLANSFNNNGTWLNPLEIIRNGLNG